MLVVLILLSAGCRGTGVVVPPRAEADLMVVDSLLLSGPAVSICRDGDGLLVLESSGARLLELDSQLVVVETIPLSERVVAPRGIAADRFYVYVHDDRVLYRMLKSELVLTSWLNNTRVAGLAGYSTGEMLISDEERKVIWYKTLFGGSRVFLGVGEVRQPGPVVALGDGLYCVLSARSMLVFFNQAGIRTRAIQLAGEYDLLAAADSSRLLLGRRGQPEVVLVKGGVRVRFGLDRSPEVAAMAVLSDRLVVLDRGSRILTYRLP